MAVKFSTNDGLYLEDAVISAMPFSVTLWFRADDVTQNHPLFWVGDKNDANIWCDLEARGGQGGDPVRLVQKWTVVNYQDAQSAAYSANTWHHVVGVWESTTSRSVWLDGTEVNETAASVALSGYDRLSIGALMDSTPSYTDWQELAEVALYDAVLPDATIALLAMGWSPIRFRDDLVGYWPLVEDYTDLSGNGNTLTATGTPTVVAHPPGIRDMNWQRKAMEVFTPGAVAAEVFSR